jgi:hypothetical protein
VRAVIAAVICVSAVLARSSFAQDLADGDTLPAHAGGLIIRPGTIYGESGLRFGPGGWSFGRQSTLTDYNNIRLSSLIGGANASAIDTLLGDLGTTRFNASQIGVGVNFIAAYGVTDRLTVAAFLPYQYSRYRFDAWLVPSPGNIRPAPWSVKDPKAITCPGGQFQLNSVNDLQKILDEHDPGTYAFNVGDLRKALISDCLHYDDPVDSVSRQSDGYYHGVSDRSLSGFRDFVFGAKYQFFHGSHLNLAGIGYVTAPTGRQEKPDDLFHLRLGDGTWTYTMLAGATLPLGKVRLFGAAGYEYVFQDTNVRRLSGLSFSDAVERQLASGAITEKQLTEAHLDDGSLNPIVTKYDEATVTRKLGDNIYVYVGGGYEIFEWLSIGARFDFWHHFRDSIQSIGQRLYGAPPFETDAQIRADVDQLVKSGMVPEDPPGGCFDNPGADCRSKEISQRLQASVERKKDAYAWHTVRGYLVGTISLNFNFLGPFIRDEFPIPLIGSIWISRYLAGQNIDITDMLGMALTVPIPFGDIKDPAEYGFDDQGGGLPWP